MSPVQVSVIIPTLNEAAVLARTLETIEKYNPCEIIIGDGGSEDGTLDIAGKFNARVVPSPPGRALQMNAAAGRARGDTLLFLHADSTMEHDGYRRMIRLMSEARTVGGAFSLRIQSPRWSLRLISRVATLRAKYLRIVYGDQAIFVRGETFRRMGGFSPIPICEDMDFFNRLKKEGKTVILEEKTTTSPRRWQAEGVLYTTLRNWLIAGLFLLGFPPRILSKWYLAIR
ncbi:MAG: TIGR04283 family arsenosugar biosynthesis glycosyltransferase [Nitrospinales bacterium]